MPVMVSLSTGHLNKLSARPIVNTKHSVAPKLADIELSLSTPGSLPAVHVQHVLDHCSLAASGQPPSVVCVCEVVLFQSDKGGGMLKPDCLLLWQGQLARCTHLASQLLKSPFGSGVTSTALALRNTYI